jgi:hypothetical protein
MVFWARMIAPAGSPPSTSDRDRELVAAAPHVHASPLELGQLLGGGWAGGGEPKTDPVPRHVVSLASRVARDFLEPYPNGVGVEWPACSTTRAATSQEAPQRGTVAQ